MTMTSEQRQAYITALLEERRGYVQRGNDAAVAEVDAQLRAVGHDGATPAQRAEKRPRTRKVETR